MSYRIETEPTGVKALVYEGWQDGISSSPHIGIGNMQGVNTSTEPGEVMCNYARTQQSMTSTSATGTLAFVDSSHVSLNISGSNNLLKGMWINVSASSHTGELANDNYWVTLSAGNNFQLSSSYNGPIKSGFTSGLTATITLVRTMSQPLASAYEVYSSYYRYYILDSQGLVWVYDTALASSTDNIYWFLPDTALVSGATGIAVLNGWVMVFAGTTIYCKSTVNLGGTPGWLAFASGNMLSSNQHATLVGHQSTLYYTDGNIVGSIFPTTSYASNVPNLFSYASYTSTTTTGTMTLIAGSIPYNGTDNSVRLPVVPFAAAGGSVAAALTAGTVYYLKWLGTGTTFELYSASSGGSALDITTGASGTQYFNTFYPVSASGKTLQIFSPTALTLPYFEIAQAIGEIGNVVVVGTKGNTLYQWGQANAQADGFIPLPENNIVNIVTVHNMAYIFAGSKGNIYVSNGSTASLVISIPDYTSGIIEPYYTWGGAAFIRGRIFFSIQDQISGHTGQCGGIWSFIPPQNYMLGGDNFGISLRMENQNSYASYNGRATVIVANQDQSGRGAQYWSAWVSSITSATYGIDYTDTKPSTAAVIETDIVPVGTILDKKSFSQIEYKLAASLDGVGDSVTIKYRTNLGASFTSLPTRITESSQSVSGYYPVNFQGIQWLQLQITLTPTSSSNSSFVRLTEVRVR